jgi:hypothetical protein
MARQGRENQYRDRRGADDQTGICGTGGPSAECGEVGFVFCGIVHAAGRDTSLKLVMAVRVAAEFNMTCTILTNFRVQVSRANRLGR